MGDGSVGRHGPVRPAQLGLEAARFQSLVPALVGARVVTQQGHAQHAMQNANMRSLPFDMLVF